MRTSYFGTYWNSFRLRRRVRLRRLQLEERPCLHAAVGNPWIRIHRWTCPWNRHAPCAPTHPCWGRARTPPATTATPAWSRPAAQPGRAPSCGSFRWRTTWPFRGCPCDQYDQCGARTPQCQTEGQSWWRVSRAECPDHVLPPPLPPKWACVPVGTAEAPPRGRAGCGRRESRSRGSRRGLRTLPASRRLFSSPQTPGSVSQELKKEGEIRVKFICQCN